MRDTDQMKELRKKYIALMERHGEDVTEYKAFREALLELNRQHRRDAIQMYVDMISKIEKNLSG